MTPIKLFRKNNSLDDFTNHPGGKPHERCYGVLLHDAEATKNLA